MNKFSEVDHLRLFVHAGTRFSQVQDTLIISDSNTFFNNKIIYIIGKKELATIITYMFFSMST